MPDYLVKTTVARMEAAGYVRERLVRAKNEARAVAHVVKDTVAIERASNDDIIRLTQAGVSMEVAE